jgi:general stress protein YciG
MTVAEAGRMGGEKTFEAHGSEFYSKIGSKGGQKVRKLIAEGKERRNPVPLFYFFSLTRHGCGGEGQRVEKRLK